MAFPSFTEPSEIFIADSGKIIPGVVDTGATGATGAGTAKKWRSLKSGTAIPY